MELQEKTKVIIGIHQEDERIQGVMSRRPYLDVGLIILRKSNDGSVTLHEVREMQFERQVDLEVDLDPGSYIVLPKTSGCTLRRPSDAVNENIKMLDKNRRLNELVHSTILDIFRKYDMLLTRELTYVEFKGFYECLNKTVSQQEFETQILNSYSSTQRGLTLAGFIEFFKDAILTYGEVCIFTNI